MSMEPAFVDVLGSVRSFTVDGTRLTLTGAERSLTFDAEQPEALVGITWRIDGLIDGEVASSTIAGTQPFILLDPDGSASGDGSCNRFGAPYTLEGERLSFGPIEATRMACTEAGVMEQEAAILRALSSTTSFAIQGQVLSLLDDGGRVVLTLVAD